MQYKDFLKSDNFGSSSRTNSQAPHILNSTYLLKHIFVSLTVLRQKGTNENTNGLLREFYPNRDGFIRN